MALEIWLLFCPPPTNFANLKECYCVIIQTNYYSLIQNSLDL